MEKLLYLCCFFFLFGRILAGPIVSIPQGNLEGDSGINYDGNSYYKFLGIPYAKPPVESLRFREPIAAEGWEGVRSATAEGSMCVQDTGGSEDCLYLNIYTRDLPGESQTPKPVMVWIHGGAFTSGSGSADIYGPDFLITEDVVLVTINYRLGILGFLRFQDINLNVTGNMGLKDQLLALKWVKNNIQFFNGNPADITIFGQSAGSASVHYHVLSSASSGLFNKAILQSGTGLDDWADECDHDALGLAKLANFSVTTETEALEEFERLNTDGIMLLQNALLLLDIGANIRSLGLVIELDHPTAFITERLIDVITSGNYNQVPLMIGYNNREAIMFNEVRKNEGIKLTPEECIPYNVDFYGNETARAYYVGLINETYLSGPNEDDNAIAVISDSYFIAGIIGAVQNHVLNSKSSVYLYKVSLDTQLNIGKAAYNVSYIPGASHADDIGYLFKTNITPEIIPGSIEEISIKRFVKLWTNFAKYGNPTPSEDDVGVLWFPATTDKINTFHIDETLVVEVNPEKDMLEFWRAIFRESEATYNYVR